MLDPSLCGPCVPHTHCTSCLNPQFVVHACCTLTAHHARPAAKGHMHTSAYQSLSMGCNPHSLHIMFGPSVHCGCMLHTHCTSCSASVSRTVPCTGMGAPSSPRMNASQDHASCVHSAQRGEEHECLTGPSQLCAQCEVLKVRRGLFQIPGQSHGVGLEVAMRGEVCVTHVHPLS